MKKIIIGEASLKDRAKKEKEAKKNADKTPGMKSVNK